MRKETIKKVPKKWGEEMWLVNNGLYCGKLLFLKKNATCSYHYHKIKQETFYVPDGEVVLTIEGKDYILDPYARPKTIMPGEKHKFFGLKKSVIIEVSTHHSDNDVFRLTESIVV